MAIKKLLFVGDPHFKVNNNDYVDAFVTKTIEVVDSICPDLCVVGGDVLDTHERLHQVPFNKAVSFLKELSRRTRTVVLVGNHDYVNNQQFLSDNHWMNCLKGTKDLVIADRVVHERGMVFVPYVPPGRFQEALSTLEGFDWRSASCIFAHQEFRGCNLGVNVSSSGDAWPADYPLVVSGHIHKKHRPQKNVVYPGSVIQTNFGEQDNDGGLYVIEMNTEGGLVDYSIPIDIPRMYTIETTADDLPAVLANLRPTPLQRVRIICSGFEDEIKAAKKAFAKKLPPSVHLVMRHSNVRPPRREKYTRFSEILDRKIRAEDLGEFFSRVRAAKDFEELQ